jgi:hypothetical protein
MRRETSLESRSGIAISVRPEPVSRDPLLRTSVTADADVLAEVADLRDRVAALGDSRLPVGRARMGHGLLIDEVRLPAGTAPLGAGPSGRRRGAWLTDAEGLAVAIDVAGAVAAAHGVGVAHGALAREHLLLSEDRVFVSGFGLGPVRARADGADDVAAVGRLLIELGVTAGLPTGHDLLRAVADATAADPAARPTARQLHDRLSDAFDRLYAGESGSVTDAAPGAAPPTGTPTGARFAGARSAGTPSGATGRAERRRRRQAGLL